MIRAGLFVVLTAFFALPLRAQKIVAEPFPPAKFASLYIERDEKGATISLQLAGDALIYKTTFQGKELESVTVHPSDDDWFKFIQAINAAKVYQWSSTSAGTNEFPKEGDVTQGQANPPSGPSVPFQLFWQAAMTLVGKAPPPASAK
jgi:hypothetical protein